MLPISFDWCVNAEIENLKSRKTSPAFCLLRIVYIIAVIPTALPWQG